MDRKANLGQDVNIRKKMQLTGHKSAVFALCPGESANIFYSAGGDGWIVRWDLEEPDPGKLIARVETQVFSIAWLPAQRTLVAGNMNGGLHWVPLEDPGNNRNIAHHQKGIFGFLPLRDRLLTVGGDGKLTAWDPEKRRSLETLHLSNRSLRSISYSSARNELAIGSSDQHIYLLDADTLGIRYIIKQAHGQSVFTLQYSYDGQRLFSGGRDARLKGWSPEAPQQPLFEENAHWYTINHLLLSPDGHWLATASRDKSIKIWDASVPRLLKVLEGFRDEGHFHSVNRLWWAPDGRHLVSASDDRSLIIWEVNGKASNR